MKRPQQPAKDRPNPQPERQRIGGGPHAPGGDAEPSNRPGEFEELGMAPPDAEPVLPEESAEESPEPRHP